MTSATPETKAQSLLARINAAHKSGGLNEFILARFKQDANASLKVDAYHGYMALGALAALSWDIEELKQNHERAIRISDNSLAHRNYASSLASVLLYDQASEQAIIASEIDPEDLTVLVRAIDYSVMAGHISKASELIEKLKLRAPGENLKDRLNYDINGIIEVLNMTPVTEDEFCLAQEIVFDVLRGHKFSLRAIASHVDTDASEPTIFFQYAITADYQTALRINDEASSRLCEELPDGGHPDILMLGIVGRSIKSNEAKVSSVDEHDAARSI